MDLIAFPDEFKKTVVQSIEKAVGEDVLEDLNRDNLWTSNGIPSRIWDHINTNVHKSLQGQNCTTVKAARGFWKMAAMLEDNSQCLFTIIREKRLQELRKKRDERYKMHYVDLATTKFNGSLEPEQEQISFYKHTFSDEDRLEQKVQVFLSEFGQDIEGIKNYVLIVFDTQGYTVTHVRALVLTPNLEVAHGGEEDWSSFLLLRQDAIVEKVDYSQFASNTPDRGLKLKDKALKRKKDGLQLKIAESDAEVQN